MECENYRKAVRSETSFTKVTSPPPPPGSKSNDAVLAAEGAFAFQNDRLQSKFIEVQQQLNEAPYCCSKYQGNPRKSLFFFLICRISGILNICYFSRAFSYFKLQTMSTFVMK